MLMLAPSPRADPAYSLNIDVLCAYAAAVWERWLPSRMLEQGLQDAFERLRGNQNPWASIRGPFSACVATCLRIGVEPNGFVWTHSTLGSINVQELSPRTVALWLSRVVELCGFGTKSRSVRESQSSSKGAFWNLCVV